MKGDFTRYTFNPKNHYTSVRSQQGRVPLDAEANEAQDIQNYLDQTTRRDTIGACGVPQTGGGFALSLLETGSRQDFAISPGRIYVDGLLGELETGQAIVPQIRSTTSLAVAADRLEGELLEAGQWIELWSQGVTPQRLHISNVALESGSNPRTYLLTVAPAINNSAALTRPLLRRITTILFQPDYPAFSFPGVAINQPSTLPTEPGVYLAYLDLWQHHITALEDPNIKEIALGGPDTTTRTKTICQVKLARVGDLGANLTCQDFADWDPIPGTPPRLRARAIPDASAESPCLVPAQAGYRRLENQLYRVEIHRGGDASTATFKWSRDNATLVTEWTGPDTANTDTLSVASIGVDSVRRFFNDQWVEITDHTYDLHNQPGPLIQLQNVTDQTLELQGNLTRANFPRIPKVRAWDHQPTVAKPDDGTADIPLNLVEGAVPVHEGGWIDLEDGVQVFFEPGATYTAGQYWLIPARTIEGNVLWSQDDTNEPLLELPLGITHHYCRLALLRRLENRWSNDITDCRLLFPPLTDLNNLQSCGEIAVRPGDNLQTIFDRIPVGGSAKLCFHPGTWTLTTTVQANNKGHLILTGTGAATQITTTELDCVLRFSGCASVTIRDLSVRGGAAGTIGDGLQGSLSFIDCRAVTLEQIQVQCDASPSRRASAIQIWAQSSAPVLTDVQITHCRIRVGHGQTGILVVNGDRVTIAHNDIETPATQFSIPAAIADPSIAAAVGRTFINRILVAREFDDEAINEVIDRGDFGLGDPIEYVNSDDPPDSLGQIRLVGQMPQWGPDFFVFSTHVSLSPRVWTELLEANPILVRDSRDIPSAVVVTKLRQLRARLARRLFGDRSAAVTIPAIASRALDTLVAEIRDRNAITTGGQGIVVAGNRTPRFGANEPFANGLFIIDGDRAPTVHVNHNHIIGFAQGIHIGTSDDTSRHYRSYHIEVASNTIQLRAPTLAQERHGIFVGNAHTVKVQDNLIELVFPNASNWVNPRSRSPRTSPPPTDGIHLEGFYGPLLHIKQNHCIGVTCGIRVRGRNAGLHETRRYNILVSWIVTNNAYAGPGIALSLLAEPNGRLK